MSTSAILHCLTTVLLILLPFSVVRAGVVDDAVVCLASRQGSLGEWGDLGGSAYRDTTVVIDALATIDPGSPSLDEAVAFLQANPPPNQDYLARLIVSSAMVGVPTAQAVDSLLEGEMEEILDPSSAAYPGGGWGVARDFGSDPLTTALGVRALREAGRSTGLAVVGSVVPPGGEVAHPVVVPEGASGFRLLIREITGSVRVLIDLPTGGTLFVDLTNVGFPTQLTGLPSVPGTYTIRVKSLSGGPNRYSLEGRFVDGDLFDSAIVTRAVSNLAFAQNDDGSWSFAAGAEGSVMLTAEVARVLAELQDGFGPSDALVRAAEWLGDRQNGDGGFGDLPGTSSVYATSLTVLALQAVDPESFALDTAIAFLRSEQQPDGCWSNDAYSTGIALQVFGALSVCRLDVDASGAADVATDVVYIARRLLGLVPIVPASFRAIHPSIPSDAEIASAIDDGAPFFDVSMNGALDVPTDVVYIARALLGLVPVPPAFRSVDPSIPPDAAIQTRIDALCP